MTTTRCYCCKYRSTERVSVNKFDCVQLGILRNQFGKKRYYLALGMGPNVGPKWRAAAIFFASHDKNVSSGGILSARRCLRTRIFFLYGLNVVPCHSKKLGTSFESTKMYKDLHRLPIVQDHTLTSIYSIMLTVQNKSLNNLQMQPKLLTNTSKITTPWYMYMCVLKRLKLSVLFITTTKIHLSSPSVELYQLSRFT